MKRAPLSQTDNSEPQNGSKVAREWEVRNALAAWIKVYKLTSLEWCLQLDAVHAKAYVKNMDAMPVLEDDCCVDDPSRVAFLAANPYQKKLHSVEICEQQIGLYEGMEAYSDESAVSSDAETECMSKEEAYAQKIKYMNKLYRARISVCKMKAALKAADDGLKIADQQALSIIYPLARPSVLRMCKKYVLELRGYNLANFKLLLPQVPAFIAYFNQALGEAMAQSQQLNVFKYKTIVYILNKLLGFNDTFDIEARITCIEYKITMLKYCGYAYTPVIALYNYCIDIAAYKREDMLRFMRYYIQAYKGTLQRCSGSNLAFRKLAKPAQMELAIMSMPIFLQAFSKELKNATTHLPSDANEDANA